MLDYRETKPTIEVTVKADRKTHVLSLIPQPWRGRYWICYNGKVSNKMPESTISKLMEEVRKIVVASQKKER